MTKEQNSKKIKWYIVSALVILCIVSIFIFKKKNDEQSIKIGTLLPLTKQASQYGIATKHGIDMCIEKINNSGGIDGKKVTCIEFDDEGDPGKAVVGYNFLKDKGVSAIITGVISDTALPIVDQAQHDGIPIIMTTASADDVTFNKQSGEIYDNIFRVGFTNSFQGEKAAEFANSKGIKNAAVLFCGESEYSSGLKDSFVNKCKNFGINIVAIENFSLNSVDFQRQLENIKSKNPDFVFIPYYRETISLILSQVDNLGINCMIFGPDGWRGVTEYISDPSCLKNKNYFYCDLCAPDDPSGDSKSFFEEYKNKFSEIPNLCSVCGYNASVVLTESIKSSIDKKIKINTNDFKKDIINNLKNINVSCVSGNIAFDKYHNSSKQALIIQIKDGKEQFYQKI